MELTIAKYAQLANRKSWIITHSGADWKPEYEQELAGIDKELAELRKVIDEYQKGMAGK